MTEKKEREKEGNNARQKDQPLMSEGCAVKSLLILLFGFIYKLDLHIKLMLI